MDSSTNGSDPGNDHETEIPSLPSLDIILKAIRAARDDGYALNLLRDYSLAVREDTLHADAMKLNPLADTPKVQAALSWVRTARDLYEVAHAPGIEREEAIYLLCDQLRYSANLLAGQLTVQAAQGIVGSYTAMLKPEASEQEGLERIADGLLVALAEPDEHRAKIIRALAAARKMQPEEEPRRSSPYL